MANALLVCFLFASWATAFQFPFKVPFFSVDTNQHTESTPKRIAVIGAGAGGTSAAWFTHLAKQRFGVDVEVDVYEKNGYVGGRSTTVSPYEDVHVELGASIFTADNKNLWRASDEFNLTRRDFKDEDQVVGVYDGSSIILSISGSWWDTAKIIWRYGIMSPRRTQNEVNAMVKQYLNVYTATSPRWDNVSTLAENFGWTERVSHIASDYLQQKGISAKYIEELINAAVRVNYGQNVDTIHGLEAMASLAANDATSVKGGNFQIFEQFLARSGANVYLNTTVASVFPKSSTSHHWTVRSKELGDKDYRAVILAAPFASTNISFPPAIVSQVPKQPYVHLHVTLIITTSPTFRASYFGLPHGSSVLPTMMLTTSTSSKEPEFNSISYHGQVRKGEWIVKVFSKQTLSDEWLSTIIDGEIKWVYRKEWDAYPRAPPTTTFPPIRLDRGLWYVNAFEPFMSTMETETVAARNVVDLMLSEEFDTGICGKSLPSSSPVRSSVEKDFVLGWDC